MNFCMSQSPLVGGSLVRRVSGLDWRRAAERSPYMVDLAHAYATLCDASTSRDAYSIRIQYTSSIVFKDHSYIKGTRDFTIIHETDIKTLRLKQQQQQTIR